MMMEAWISLDKTSSSLNSTRIFIHKAVMLKQLLGYLQRVTSNSTFLKMAESLQVSLGKRHAEDTDKVDSQKRHADDTDKVDSDIDLQAKKPKKQKMVQLGTSEGRKRKIAMLVAYNGAGYYGVQVNPGFRTIESEIFPALVNIGAIPQDHADTPSKMWFQRGSRTDKGVSAVGQIFSLKITVLVPDLVTKINELLPPQIRVMGYVRTTNGYDSKNWCDSRTYMYMTPTYAFAPINKFITEEYRTTDDVLVQVRTVLSKFVGTHKFHNFTSGVKYEQASASRYIMKFECSEPYIREGIEFVTIQVKGQSFMLHHIRKMMGLTIAILRGYCGEGAIEASWGPEKVDIPKAPGLGLVLETLHVDHYNRKFGSDGLHEPIDWSQYQEAIDKFKEEQIISYIVSQEKSERVMFNWLRTLQYHNFDQRRLEGPQKPWLNVIKMLSQKSPEQSDSQDVMPVSEDVASDISNTGETSQQIHVIAGMHMSSESPDKDNHISSVSTQSVTVHSSTEQHQLVPSNVSDSQTTSSACSPVTVEDSTNIVKSSVV